MAAGSKNVRLFLRAAERRLADARVLEGTGDPDRMTGAVYLAGYAVECGLMAMLLSAVPAAREAGVLATFRGAAAHDLRSLRRRYLETGGAAPPRRIARAFGDVSAWSVALRYDPGRFDRREAARVFAAAEQILHFCTETAGP